MEHFTYSKEEIRIRKRDCSKLQKVFLHSIWILVTLVTITGITYQQNYHPEQSWLLYASIFLPLICGFALMLLIVFNPKGDEKDFVVPGVELDPDDSSRVQGTITTMHGEEKHVEVVVPNVYSPTFEILSEGTGQSNSSGLAHEEMIEMALEVIHNQYPDSKWNGQPAVLENPL